MMQKHEWNPGMWVLSESYPMDTKHDRVSMFFKNLRTHVLWTKVASALEGLDPHVHVAEIPWVFLLLDLLPEHMFYSEVIFLSISQNENIKNHQAWMGKEICQSICKDNFFVAFQLSYIGLKIIE